MTSCRSGNYIAGHWSPSVRADRRIELVNPANGDVFGSVSNASEHEVGVAVDAAKQALSGDWASSSVTDRRDVVSAMRDALLKRTEEIAEIQTISMGAPIRISRKSVPNAVRLIDAYLDALDSTEFAVARTTRWGAELIEHGPIGVVAAITSWNSPLTLAVNKVAAALLAGCSVVLKPAAETPFEAGILAEIGTEAGLPAGVLNVVTGNASVGEALVRHPAVEKITFTGSTVVGRRIAELSANRFARLSLELGGKSAAIILPDVDLDEVMSVVGFANFDKSGQHCIGLTRVLAPRAMYAEVVDAAIAAARSYEPGDPLMDTTMLGPVAVKRQQDRILRHLEQATREGAEIVAGGRVPAGFEKGFYIEATVLSSVTNQMRIAREEIFGPVMCVIPYEDEKEAIALANDSSYGLHGAVFTQDLKHGLEIARQIHTGTVALNSFGTDPSTSFGGVKDSGIGREKGAEGIASFLETKSYKIPEALIQTLTETGAN